MSISRGWRRRRIWKKIETRGMHLQELGFYLHITDDGTNGISPCPYQSTKKWAWFGLEMPHCRLPHSDASTLLRSVVPKGSLACSTCLLSRRRMSPLFHSFRTAFLDMNAPASSNMRRHSAFNGAPSANMTASDPLFRTSFHPSLAATTELKKVSRPMESSANTSHFEEIVFRTSPFHSHSMSLFRMRLSQTSLEEVLNVSVHDFPIGEVTSLIDGRCLTYRIPFLQFATGAWKLFPRVGSNISRTYQRRSSGSYGRCFAKKCNVHRGFGRLCHLVMKRYHCIWRGLIRGPHIRATWFSEQHFLLCPWIRKVPTFWQSQKIRFRSRARQNLSKEQRREYPCNPWAERRENVGPIATLRA